MSVFLEGEAEAFIGVVDCLVSASPMSVDNAASATGLMAILATEGGTIETLETLVKNFLGEERFLAAKKELDDAALKYINSPKSLI